MFFILTIPTILETVITVVTTTIVARAASDIYDKVTTTQDKK